MKTYVLFCISLVLKQCYGKSNINEAYIDQESNSINFVSINTIQDPYLMPLTPNPMITTDPPQSIESTIGASGLTGPGISASDFSSPDNLESGQDFVTNTAFQPLFDTGPSSTSFDEPPDSKIQELKAMFPPSYFGEQHQNFFMPNSDSDPRVNEVDSDVLLVNSNNVDTNHL